VINQKLMTKEEIAEVEKKRAATLGVLLDEYGGGPGGCVGANRGVWPIAQASKGKLHSWLPQPPQDLGRTQAAQGSRRHHLRLNSRDHTRKNRTICGGSARAIRLY
jgi:hypothetical protein